MLWVGESHDSYEGVGPCGAAHALTRSRTAIAGTRSGSNPTSLGSERPGRPGAVLPPRSLASTSTPWPVATMRSSWHDVLFITNCNVAITSSFVRQRLTADRCLHRMPTLPTLGMLQVRTILGQARTVGVEGYRRWRRVCHIRYSTTAFVRGGVI